MCECSKNRTKHFWIRPERVQTEYALVIATLWPLGSHPLTLNTLRMRQNGRHFADGSYVLTFMCVLFFISIQTFCNLSPVVQLAIRKHWVIKKLTAKQMASQYINQSWAILLTHTYVTRPQWVRGSISMHDIVTIVFLETLTTMGK